MNEQTGSKQLAHKLREMADTLDPDPDERQGLDVDAIVAGRSRQLHELREQTQAQANAPVDGDAT